jgi:hypothetical protein
MTAETRAAARTPLDGLLFGGLEGARAFADAGAEAFSRSLNKSSRAALAAQSLTADYAGRLFKLNLSAVPHAAAPGAAGQMDWTRPLAVGGQFAEIYASYLRDCGQVVADALRDDAA